MKRHEANKLNMLKAVNAVLESSITIVSEYPALSEAAAELKTKIAEINAIDMIFSTSIDGKTSTKNMLEDELIEDLMPVKAALYAYSVRNKNEELKTLTKESESTLKRMRDPEFLQKAELIKTEAQKHLTDLAAYKITEIVLTELQEKITAFGEALDGKDTGFANRSALRIALTEKFDEADNILTEQLDALIELVRKSNTLFYDQYYVARVIKDLGTPQKTEGVKTPEPVK